MPDKKAGEKKDVLILRPEQVREILAGSKTYPTWVRRQERARRPSAAKMDMVIG